jgi:hypothetical protein
LDFIPPYQIFNMSMNGLRRGATTCDKAQTETGMDETLIELDLSHWVSSSLFPLLLFCYPKNHLL